MPNRRGSTKRRIVPSSKAKVRCSCGPHGGAVEHQPARHAEMQQQHGAVVEKALDELGAAREAGRPCGREAWRRSCSGSGNRMSARRCTRPVTRRPAAAPPARASSSRPPAAPASIRSRPRRLPGMAARPRTPHPRAMMSAAICMSEHRHRKPAGRPSGDPARAAADGWRSSFGFDEVEPGGKGRCGSATSSTGSPPATT